jgi:hypothetical protein
MNADFQRKYENKQNIYKNNYFKTLPRKEGLPETIFRQAQVLK